MVEVAVNTSIAEQLARTATRIRYLVVTLTVGLIVLILAWQFDSARSVGSVLLGTVLALPLLIPLPSLIRGRRRSFAACTLCVIPYFVIGLTEAVAQPATRAWSGACLAIALALFVALIAYLRTTRPTG
jgi:uncharacterized membrane protein